MWFGVSKEVDEACVTRRRPKSRRVFLQNLWAKFVGKILSEDLWAEVGPACELWLVQAPLILLWHLG